LYRNNELLAATTSNSFTDIDPIIPAQYYLFSYDVNENQSLQTSIINITTQLLGDLTYDSTVNVLDIISLVDIVINISENGYVATDYELEAADIYMDGQLNIIDIVGLVNIILEQ